MPSISSHPVEIDIDWRAVGHLLNAGQYEQIADLLDLSSHTSATVDQPLLSSFVTAVRQICLACHQCHTEVEWHQQAGEKAAHQEDLLRDHARIIIERIFEWKTDETPVTASSDEIPPAEVELRQVREHADWWRRILQRLGRTTQWLRSWYAALAPLAPRSIEPPAMPSREIAEQEVEQAVLPSVEPLEPTAAPPVETTMQVHPPEPPAPPAETAAVTSAPEGETASTPPAEVGEPGRQRPPSLTVYCLGLFRVYQDEQPVEAWTSSRGQAIFKYLVTHREHPIAKEVLMELFWPEANPEAARNNLNVAIYGLRRALRPGRPDFSHVIFQNDAYLLNPELHLWVDVEQFIHHSRTGQRWEQAGALDETVREYRAAEALYQGEFLAEDRYEDWVLPLRQSLQDDYLTLLTHLSRFSLDREDYDSCMLWCNKLLAIDACREDIHRRLMRCYSRQGHYHLALRQYQLCMEALARELDVTPDVTTQELVAQIRQQRPV